jgi:hypothetical protein
LEEVKSIGAWKLKASKKCQHLIVRRRLGANESIIEHLGSKSIVLGSIAICQQFSLYERCQGMRNIKSD